jgi:hypothetical protein
MRCLLASELKTLNDTADVACEELHEAAKKKAVTTP